MAGSRFTAVQERTPQTLQQDGGKAEVRLGSCTGCHNGGGGPAGGLCMQAELQ